MTCTCFFTGLWDLTQVFYFLGVLFVEVLIPLKPGTLMCLSYSKSTQNCICQYGYMPVITLFSVYYLPVFFINTHPSKSLILVMSLKLRPKDCPCLTSHLHFIFTNQHKYTFDRCREPCFPKSNFYVSYLVLSVWCPFSINIKAPCDNSVFFVLFLSSLLWRKYM